MYTYNLVSKLRGYVFVWSYLKGFGEWKGEENGRKRAQSAIDLGKKEQQQMMDPEGLAIPDVQLIIDSTKVEIIDYFKAIIQKVEQIVLEEGCRVGVFIVNVGHRLYELNDGGKRN